MRSVKTGQPNVTGRAPTARVFSADHARRAAAHARRLRRTLHRMAREHEKEATRLRAGAADAGPVRKATRERFTFTWQLIADDWTLPLKDSFARQLHATFAPTLTARQLDQTAAAYARLLAAERADVRREAESALAAMTYQTVAVPLLRQWTRPGTRGAEHADHYTSAAWLTITRVVKHHFDPSRATGDERAGQYWAFVRQHLAGALAKEVGRTEHALMGRDAFESRNHIKNVAGQLTQRLRREPSISEVAEAAGEPAGRVARVLNTESIISLDAPGLTDSRTRLDTLQQPVDNQGDCTLADLVAAAVPTRGSAAAAHYTPDELNCLEVCALYFGLNGHEPTSLTEIADLLGIHRNTALNRKNRGLGYVLDTLEVAAGVPPENHGLLAQIARSYGQSLTADTQRRRQYLEKVARSRGCRPEQLDATLNAALAGIRNFLTGQQSA